jgi:hypothetical protein
LGIAEAAPWPSDTSARRQQQHGSAASQDSWFSSDAVAGEQPCLRADTVASGDDCGVAALLDGAVRAQLAG